jgi:hypothetical protein
LNSIGTGSIIVDIELANLANNLIEQTPRVGLKGFALELGRMAISHSPDSEAKQSLATDA